MAASAIEKIDRGSIRCEFIDDPVPLAAPGGSPPNISVVYNYHTGRDGSVTITPLKRTLTIGTFANMQVEELYMYTHPINGKEYVVQISDGVLYLYRPDANTNATPEEMVDVAFFIYATMAILEMIETPPQSTDYFATMSKVIIMGLDVDLYMTLFDLLSATYLPSAQKMLSMLIFAYWSKRMGDRYLMVPYAELCIRKLAILGFGPKFEYVHTLRNIIDNENRVIEIVNGLSNNAIRKTWKDDVCHNNHKNLCDVAQPTAEEIHVAR